MKGKRICGLVVIVCLLFTVAYGAVTTTDLIQNEGSQTDGTINKAVMLDTTKILGGQTDNLYFGTYKQSSDGSGGYKIEPIKWRVLSNANDKLFVVSDKNLDVSPYHLDYETVEWSNSTIRSWLNGYNQASNIGEESGVDYSVDNFMNVAFSAKEQFSIVDTTIEGATDKLFGLSVAEVNNSSYFKDDASRVATNTDYVASGGRNGAKMYPAGQGDFWWLRSVGEYTRSAANVNNSGLVDVDGVRVNDANYAVRPAFNLNAKDVLFVSDSVAKTTSLQKVGNATSNDWKLTLKDENSFETASVDKTNVAVGGTITVTHPALSTINAEYTNVTAVLSNATNGVVCYGSINNSTSATTSSFVIPDGIEGGEYTLSLYGEEWNGENFTDFATGMPFTTTVTVSDYTEVEIKSYDNETKKITVVSPTEYKNAVLIIAEYINDGIKLKSVSINKQINLMANQTTILDVPSDFNPTDGNSIKIFIWKDLESQMPIAKSFER